MAVVIQIRRGLEADRTSVTPSNGEFLWVTDTNSLYVGDGSTAGGNLLLEASAQVKHNFAATADPVVGDDSADGYSVGSVWINVTSDDAWICADASAGAAVWQQINGGGGSGVGGINYITNFDAETDTTGWGTYADAAGTTPVDGTGGSATTTFTRTTSSPLRDTASFLLTKDAADRQGEGASYDFTIDSADKNAVLSIQFDAEAGSGYDAEDVSVHVYDVTGTALAPISTDNAIPGTGNHKLTFSTNSNTSYRLIFHINSTNATAWTLKLDNILVGPQEVTNSAAVTEWTEFTPTITNVTTSGIEGQWRRVGGNMEVSVSAVVSAVSATVLPTLPAGYSIDTTRLPIPTSGEAVLGTAMAYDASGLLRWSGSVIINFGTLYIVNSDGSGNTWTNVQPFTWAAGDYLELSFTVPIVGWSSNQVIQPASTFRWAERYAATATRVTSTPSALGEYRAWYKSASSYIGRGTDTALTSTPMSVADGIRIWGDDKHGDAGTPGQPNAIEIHVGRGKYVTPQWYRSAGRTGYVMVPSSVVQWDFGGNLYDRGAFVHYDPQTGNILIDAGWSFSNSITGRSVGQDEDGNSIDTAYFDLIVSDNPQALALKPSVYAEYIDTTSQSLTGLSTLLAYGTKVRDTHDVWDGNTFTAPFDDEYTFVPSVGTATNVNGWVQFRVNSTNTEVSTQGANSLFQGTFKKFMAEGETAEFQFGVTVTRASTSFYNRLVITNGR